MVSLKNILFNGSLATWFIGNSPADFHGEILRHTGWLRVATPSLCDYRQESPCAAGSLGEKRGALRVTPAASGSLQRACDHSVIYPSI